MLHHHPGTFPITSGWFSLSGIDGKGSLAGGLLVAVFMIAGWDATVYVNEEVRHRRTNPGLAAVIAVGSVTIIYVIAQLGLQGVVSPAKLQANSASALVYIANALGGGSAAKIMALALALSVIASTGVTIVIVARMLYGFASHRVLPAVLSNVNRRFATPVIATIAVGGILIAITWVYLLSSSIANAFTALIDVSGILYASFYLLTGLPPSRTTGVASSAMPGMRCSSASSPCWPPGSWYGSCSSPCRVQPRRRGGHWSASSPSASSPCSSPGSDCGRSGSIAARKRAEVTVASHGPASDPAGLPAAPAAEPAAVPAIPVPPCQARPGDYKPSRATALAQARHAARRWISRPGQRSGWRQKIIATPRGVADISL